MGKELNNNLNDDIRQKINKKLDEKKEEIMDKTRVKKLFSDLEVDDIISDLFYNSVKVIFDTGFNLAKNLNFDFIANSIEQAQKDQENIKSEQL